MYKTKTSISSVNSDEIAYVLLDKERKETDKTRKDSSISRILLFFVKKCVNTQD